MISESPLDANQHEYLTPTSDRVVDQKFVKLIADYILERVRGQSVLELGVGDQVWTPMLVRQFSKVTTVDGSPVLLKAMGERLESKGVSNWTPVVSYFENYRPKEKFDLIFATYILEHVDDPRVILEAARDHWLVKGGRMVICVPHALSFHRRLAVKMGLISRPNELGETDHRMEHQRCFTYLEMEELIESVGLKVAEKRGTIFKPFPNKQLESCNDLQLKALFELGLELPIEYGGGLYYQVELE